MALSIQFIIHIYSSNIILKPWWFRHRGRVAGAQRKGAGALAARRAVREPRSLGGALDLELLCAKLDGVAVVGVGARRAS